MELKFNLINSLKIGSYYRIFGACCKIFILLISNENISHCGEYVTERRSLISDYAV